jgi:hypothetical protein
MRPSGSHPRDGVDVQCRAAKARFLQLEKA